MATLTDIAPASQPPSFVKLTNADGSRGVLLAEGHGVAHDLGGHWFCEIQGADGIGGAREIELEPESAHETLRAAVANLYGAAAAKHEYPRPPKEFVSADDEPVTVDFWWEVDNLRDSGERLGTIETYDDPLAVLTVPEAFSARLYLRVSASGGSTITSVFAGESYRCEVVSSADGLLLSLRHLPRWDVAQAYWSFLSAGREEAAEAAASGLLDALDGTDVSEHALVAAAHATLRFPWLRLKEGGLGHILAKRINGLVDLTALDWARAFDRDPADDDVFDERFVRLVDRLQAEPPAYAATIHVLLERLRTAVAERERMLDRRDEVGRGVVRTVRAFAAASRLKGERLVFEGEAPLLPTRRAIYAPTQKKTEDPQSAPTSFGS